jgi:hypothetical protein
VLRDFDESILHVQINSHGRKLQIADRLIPVCVRPRPVTNFFSRILMALATFNIPSCPEPQAPLSRELGVEGKASGGDRGRRTALLGVEQPSRIGAIAIAG